VPCFHALATEEEEMAWNFWVHHFDSKEDRDKGKYVEGKGILYPRAGTLGGCTAHNAMITVVPHDSDWDYIAKLTGDESWAAGKMWKYFQRVERCLYRKPPKRGKESPTGHGFSGWLPTSHVDPRVALGDEDVIKVLLSTLRWAALRFWYRGLIWRIKRFLLTGDDPNDIRNRAAFEGMTTTIPLATACGRRNGAREFVRNVKTMYPDRLTLKLNHLATRVLLDEDKRAVGVECRVGNRLYRADPNAEAKPQYTTREYRCTREVILAGGTFNTPQLLMLSGIGSKAHLEDPKIGIKCLVDRPGVGTNLQDRYEVGIVSRTKEPFAMLKDASFQPPGAGVAPDPCFEEWLRGGGLYTSNGAMAALILRSKVAKKDPDLFIFGLPGDFHGYYPKYSEDIEKRKDHLTWAIVKAHTNNTAGTIRLKNNDPLETPEIKFHYFEEGNDTKQEDLDAVVEAVRLVRKMNKGNHAIKEELIPGSEFGDDRLREWVNSRAWGHHASCSCPMGPVDDPNAVVDSRFQVIGTKGLRIVDASVFPRIPGFFIVTPIYMISEKAADVIVEDAQHA
jgi:choline dehydrogenase